MNEFCTISITKLWNVKFVMKVFLLAFIFNMSHPTTKVALETIILFYVALHIFGILA